MGILPVGLTVVPLRTMEYVGIHVCAQWLWVGAQ